MKTLIYSQEDLDLMISLEIQEKDEKIENLQQELQRKDNIINELKEWAEKQFLMETPLYGCVFKSMLDKIEVLENDN